MPSWSGNPEPGDPEGAGAHVLILDPRAAGAQSRVSQRENPVLENPHWWCADGMGGEKSEAGDWDRCRMRHGLGDKDRQ